MEEVDKNVAIVRSYVNEVVNKGNLSAVDTYWADDLVWRGGSLGDVNGIAAYKKMLEAAIGGGFSNMHLEILDIVAQGDRVVLLFTNSGTNTGPFLGAPASGKKAKWLGCGVYRLANGKIAEATFVEDMLGMFVQLGTLALPVGQAAG